ncbi:carboxypeptidase-like regulatory domain-containing protein [Halochromatium sp.]
MAPSAQYEYLPRWRGVGTRRRLLIALSLLILSSPSQAHRLQVFASVDGAEIQGRVYFVGGHPARGVDVELLDADGKAVAELGASDDGRFRLRAPAAQDYRVVAQTGDGHRAEWPIAASELVGALKGSAPSLEDTDRAAGAPSNRHSSLNPPAGPERSARSEVSPCSCAGADDEPALNALIERAIERGIERSIEPGFEQAVEQAVARQVLPLREALAEAQAKASIRDIIGGLGYIAGLAGLGLWWTRRRERQRRSVLDKPDG